MTSITITNPYLKSITQDEGVQRATAAVLIAVLVAGTKALIFRNEG